MVRHVETLRSEPVAAFEPTLAHIDEVYGVYDVDDAIVVLSRAYTGTLADLIAARGPGTDEPLTENDARAIVRVCGRRGGGGLLCLNLGSAWDRVKKGGGLAGLGLVVSCLSLVPTNARGCSDDTEKRACFPCAVNCGWPGRPA